MTRGTLAAVAIAVALLAPASASAANPIQHLVVVFDENVSFDHYFGTYPNATNPAGEPAFTAAGGTPVPRNLKNPTDLTIPFNNPNSAAPERIPRSMSVTCDQDHAYTAEQNAFNNNAMNKFVEFLAGGGCSDKSIVMDYYDGNSVTGLWNLAQHFTMSDAFRGDVFGPSTPGALNLAAGNTHGASVADSGASIKDGTVVGDPDPALDDCGGGGITMSGKNVGDLLNAKGVTWGWFQGGFRPTSVDAGGKATCGMSHKNAGGGQPGDYNPHHEPFQYWASTSNQHHRPPSSVAAIGTTDQANHQYDLVDFDAALDAGSLPAVSFLKAANFEDGHAGYSGPIDEQRWIARVVDRVQASPQWGSTAIVITYDDSDGWYDHSPSTITNSSNSALDAVICSGAPAPILGGYLNRCGPGPRLPFLLVSPWVDKNTINSNPLTQSSITRFIEDNWALGRVGDSSFDAGAGDMSALFNAVGTTPPTYIDPDTGLVIGSPPSGLRVAPPQPATTTTPTPTPTGPTPTPPVDNPAPTPGPTPTPAKPFAPKTTATGSRKAKKLTFKFRVKNLDPGTAKLAATVTLGKTKVGKGTVTIRSGAAKLTLTLKKKVKAGRYKLAIKVTQAGHSANSKLTVRVR